MQYQQPADLQEAILAVHKSFAPEILKVGLNLFKTKVVKAKEIVLHSGQVCNHLYFADSAIIRCFYHDDDGAEQTLWMKPERTLVTEFKSFVHRNPSQFSLQFYEASDVSYISRSDLLKLYQEYSDWAQFGIHLTEHIHITLIDVFVNLLANDATSNYQYIEYMFPRFIQVAPLKDIASMLQVTPVTLSRIRSGKQTKA